MISNPFSTAFADVLSRGEAARLSSASGVSPASISRFKSGDRIPGPEQVQQLLASLPDRGDRDALLLAYFRTVSPPREVHRIHIIPEGEAVVREDSSEMPPGMQRDIDFLTWLARRNEHVRACFGALSNMIRDLAKLERSAIEVRRD